MRIVVIHGLRGPGLFTISFGSGPFLQTGNTEMELGNNEDAFFWRRC